MICLDPQQTAEFWLKGDADKPADSRPTFITRYLTARQWIQAGEIVRLASDTDDNLKGIERLCDALKIGLCGWRNIPGDFNVERLPDLLSFHEMWEVVNGMFSAVSPDRDDLKKSDSQSASVSASSASPAEPVGV